MKEKIPYNIDKIKKTPEKTIVIIGLWWFEELNLKRGLSLLLLS